MISSICRVHGYHDESCNKLVEDADCGTLTKSMIVFPFLKKVRFASKSSYSIQLAELLQTYCLATAMSDAQPSPETDVRVSWRSWKFWDIANMKFKSTKGPVMLWDFGELWKFMADFNWICQIDFPKIPHMWHWDLEAGTPTPYSTPAETGVVTWQIRFEWRSQHF